MTKDREVNNMGNLSVFDFNRFIMGFTCSTVLPGERGPAGEHVDA